MMRYDHMGAGADMDLIGLITWLVILADLILFGFWLWQHIEKK